VGISIITTCYIASYTHHTPPILAGHLMLIVHTPTDGSSPSLTGADGERTRNGKRTSKPGGNNRRGQTLAKIQRSFARGRRTASLTSCDSKVTARRSVPGWSSCDRVLSSAVRCRHRRLSEREREDEKATAENQNPTGAPIQNQTPSFRHYGPNPSSRRSCTRSKLGTTFTNGAHSRFLPGSP